MLAPKLIRCVSSTRGQQRPSATGRVTLGCRRCPDFRARRQHARTKFIYDPFQLGGLHSNGYISDLFAKAFEIEGMKAYVELIERKERELARTCSSIKRYAPRPCSCDRQELLRRQPNDGGVSSTAAMGKESRKPGLRRLNYDMRRRSWVELGR
jgi:hypothetical protein